MNKLVDGNGNLITSSQFTAISKLRKIRNESVHLPDFTLDTSVVRDYIDTALSLAQEINDIRPNA